MKDWEVQMQVMSVVLQPVVPIAAIAPLVYLGWRLVLVYVGSFVDGERVRFGEGTSMRFEVVDVRRRWEGLLGFELWRVTRWPGVWGGFWSA